MADDLVMFVIYDRPRDYPREIVVRKYNARGGLPLPQRLVYRGNALREAREKIWELSPNAIRFTRDESDERQILECWI